MYSIETEDNHPEPDQNKCNNIVAVERFLVDEHAEGKGDRRGQVLHDADGRQLEGFRCGGEPQQRQTGGDAGADQPEGNGQVRAEQAVKIELPVKQVAERWDEQDAGFNQQAGDRRHRDLFPRVAVKGEAERQ